MPGATAATVNVLSLINKERADAGLSPVTGSTLLEGQAQKHASAMNAQERLFHSDSSTYRGECVGRGAPNWAAQVDAWMASPAHRDIILNPDHKTLGAAGSGNFRVIQFA